MKKILSVLLALVMVLSLSVSVFAEDLFVLENRASDTTDALADGFKLEGWCPSLITQYKAPDVATEFLAAIQTEGAKIQVTADVEVNGILLQSYPPEGGSDYTWAICSDGKTSEEVDGKVVTTFDAATVIAKYTSTPLKDDPSTNCSLDNFLNFAVDATGATIYGVKVIADAPAADTPAPVEEAPADTTAPVETAPAADTSAPAETGIVLAVLPMAVAAAAVVISKRK